MRKTARRHYSRSWHPPRGLSLELTTTIFALTATVVVLAIVFGGGAKQGRWSDAIVQLAALPLIVACVFQTSRLNLRDLDRFAIAIVGGLLLLPLLQLIRLPPSIWTALPGRDLFALAYNEAGIALPWLPISLDPAATWRSWLSLLPATAVFFACLGLDVRARQRLSLLIVALAVVSVLLGLAQLTQGPASALRLYASGNSGESVGFFANRNHYSAFLTCLIPITAAWAIEIVHRRGANRTMALAVCLIIFAVLILGIAMARSRAGVVLALIAAAASFFLIPAAERSVARLSLMVIAAAAALGVILAVQFALFRVLGRFEGDILADLRFTIFEVTTSAVWAYFPFGTGFGTFEEIYRIFEPREALLNAYVNHAHNDWLEGMLEGGAAAAALIIAFLIWFAVRSIAVFRPAIERRRVVDQVFPQAAAIALALLLLFSLVEFPLRTTTISVLFAWFAGLLTAPLPDSSYDTEAPGSSAWPGPQRRAQPRRRPRSHRPAMFPIS